MMKPWKLLFSVTIVLLAVLILPGKADATIVSSGDYGENLTWILDDTGTLTISGVGPMTNSYWLRIVGIKKIVIEDGVTAIADSAFDCVSYPQMAIESVVIGATVETIGARAFRACKALKEIQLSASVKEIGYDAFGECDALENIIVDPDNTIYCSVNGALLSKDKTELIRVPGGISGLYLIPESVTSFADGAFSNCKKIEAVTIPVGVRTVSKNAFYNCSSLTSVLLPESVTTIAHSAFSFCTSLPDITLPQTVSSIENCAFESCKSLRSIVIPEGVTVIKGATFYQCNSLVSVTIPKSVREIENYAFGYCSRLLDVYFGGTQSQWQNVEIASENIYLQGAAIHFAPMRGDLDGNEKLSTDDAVYLLLAVMFGPEDYPI